jgi:leucyl aminopeptidase
MLVTQFQEPTWISLKEAAEPVAEQVRLAGCFTEKNQLFLAKDLGLSLASQKEIEKQLPFNGLKEEGSCLLYVENDQTKWLLVHLPKACAKHKELLLKAFAQAGRLLLKKSLHNWYLSPFVSEFESDFVIEAALEGLLLSLYPVLSRPSQNTDLVHIATSYPRKPTWAALEAGSYAVHLARAMINTNADQMTPSDMAEIAQRLASRHESVQCHVLDEAEIKKEKMGLLLAVSRASRTPPRLVVLKYTPASQNKEAPIALVGKGISYDTGGFSIKPAESMKSQRSDMSGAATALGVFEAAVRLKIPYPLVAVLVCAENAIGSAGYKLGDTYISRKGTTVEIVNTDAEGRLALADAFDYVQSCYRPQVMIDVATLTGAVTLALGPEAAAVLSPDDKLAAQLIEAGKQAGERLWQLPLYDEYKEYLASDVADMKNAGPRIAGTCVAGIFLKQFVNEGVSWAHLDIASVAFAEKERFYFSKLATGFGVRTLLNWLLA